MATGCSPRGSYRRCHSRRSSGCSPSLPRRPPLLMELQLSLCTSLQRTPPATPQQPHLWRLSPAAAVACQEPWWPPLLLPLRVRSQAAARAIWPCQTRLCWRPGKVAVSLRPAAGASHLSLPTWLRGSGCCRGRGCASGRAAAALCCSAAGPCRCCVLGLAGATGQQRRRRWVRCAGSGPAGVLNSGR